MMRNSVIVNWFTLIVIAVGTMGVLGSCSRKMHAGGELPEGAPAALYNIYKQRIEEGHWPLGRINEAIAKYPHEAELYHLQARAYGELSEMDSAQAAMRKALSKDSNNAEYLETYSLLLEGARDTLGRESIAVAQKLVELQDTKPENWYRLALAYLRAQEPDSVISICKEHGQLMSPYYSTNLLVASAYNQKQECDSALHYAERDAQAGEQRTDAHYYAAETAMHCGNTEKAIEHFKQAAADACPDERLWEMYIAFLCDKGMEREAIESFLNLSQRCDASQDGVLRIVERLLYSVRGSILRDIDYMVSFDELFGRLDVNRRRLITQYRFYLATKQHERSYNMIKTLTDRYPTDYFWWDVRNRIEQSHLDSVTPDNWGQQTSTLRWMAKAFPFDVTSSLQYVYLLGRINLPFQQKNDTLAMFIHRYENELKQTKRREVYQVHTGDSTRLELNKRETLCKNLSILYATKGDMTMETKAYKDAWAAYDKAIKLDSMNALACNNYAYFIALYDTTRLEYARTLSERSLRIDRTNVSYLDTYGYILYLMGELDAARSTFVKLLSINPRPGRTALMHYSQVLKAMGNDASAELYRMKAEEQPD